MQEHVFSAEEQKMPRSTLCTDRELARSAEREALARLSRRGALVPLIVAFLFFLLITVGCVVVYSTFSSFLAYWNAPDVLYALLAACAALLFFVLCMPAYFGRMRMSGLTLIGEEFTVRELLHYYTSPRLLLRSLRLSLFYLIAIFAPYAVAAGGVVASFFLFENIMLVELDVIMATGIFLACCTVSLFLGALTFLAAGLVILAPAIAVGNEALSVRAALRYAFSIGKSHVFVICIYRVRSIVFFLLSLLTVGVLYVLYFAHRIQMTYLCLCMKLKGDHL